MRIACGFDHGGFPLRETIFEALHGDGHETIDLGATTYVSTDDYPDFALSVCRAVVGGEAEKGVLVCGSGAGEGGDELLRDHRADHAGAEREHVAVVVLHALRRRVGVVPDGGTDAGQLARGNRHAGSASADDDTPLALPGVNGA